VDDTNPPQATQAAQRQAASVQAEQAATELRQQRKDQMTRAVAPRQEEETEARRRADGDEQKQQASGELPRSAKMVMLNRFNGTRYRSMS
jgi:hypothetical protein